MEKIAESCAVFTEKINCDLNATAKECKETKVALIKYCSHSECAGDSEWFAAVFTVNNYLI